MSITVTWLNNAKQTIIMQYGSEWSWDEHFAAHEKAMRMSFSVPHAVNIIADVSHAGTPPERVIVHLPEIARLTQSTQVRKLIIVGLHGILQTAADIYSRSYRTLNTVDTYTEALALLNGAG